MKRSLSLALWALLALGLAAGPVFAGGASEGGGVKKVVFWNGYTGGDRPTVEAIVKNFNTANKNIQIAMEITPWDSLYQKLIPSFMAGTGPDIVGFDIARAPEYATAGRLEPLDSRLEASTVAKRDVLVQGLLAGSTIGGKLYGIPMAFHSMVMYYNKDHFAKAGLDPNNPPATLNDLEAAWKKLLVKDGSGNIVQYPQAIAVRNTVPMVPVFFWDFGADFVTADGKSSLGSANALAALTFLRRAFVDEHVSPVGLTGQEADNLFAAGKASIEWNGPWAVPSFRNAGINVGIAPMPAGPGGRFTNGGGTVLVMNKDSKVKDAAWTVMQYWNSYDTQKLWASEQAFPPTRVDMSSDADLSKNADLSFFIKEAEHAKIFLGGQTKFSQIDESVLVPLYESVFRGTVEPAAGLAKADADLAKILSQK